MSHEMLTEGQVALACADARFCLTDSSLTNRLIQQMEERAPLTAQRALIAWGREPMSFFHLLMLPGRGLGLLGLAA
jgi:hypothetical protein